VLVAKDGEGKPSRTARAAHELFKLVQALRGAGRMVDKLLIFAGFGAAFSSVLPDCVEPRPLSFYTKLCRRCASVSARGTSTILYNARVHALLRASSAAQERSFTQSCMRKGWPQLEQGWGIDLLFQCKPGADADAAYVGGD
jgi:hypothetical protein